MPSTGFNTLALLPSASRSLFPLAGNKPRRGSFPPLLSRRPGAVFSETVAAEPPLIENAAFEILNVLLAAVGMMLALPGHLGDYVLAL
jgi:hypothetical protein